MKRIVCLTVVAVLLIASFAFAEGYNITHEPIKLLGIDFGTKFDDVRQKIVNETWVQDTWEWYDPEFWTEMTKDIICSETAASGMNYPGTMFEQYAYGDGKVAGYEIEEMKLYYACGTKSDTELSSDVNDGVFYAGIYHVNATNVNSVYGDLKTKLTQVYGADTGLKSEEVFEKFSPDDGSFLRVETTYALWESDANDSYLVLKANDYPAELNDYASDYVEIMYVWKEADSILNRNIAIAKGEALAAESILYGNNDTSGL